MDTTVGAARTITIAGLSTYSGQVGTIIKITGNSFNPVGLPVKVDAVYFGCSNSSSTCTGGTKTTPSSVSNTEITVQVPQGATTGYIQVYAPTTPTASWSTYSPQPFTVEASVPAPTISGLSSNSGVVGESVTITGTNFNQNATVKFGCAAASCGKTAPDATSITFVDPQTIQAQIPKGAPNGYLQVATASGAAYSPNSFTVNTPSITNIDPATGTAGSPLTINGSFFSGTTLVTFAGGADGKGVPVFQSGFEVLNGGDKASQIIVSAIPTGAQTGQILVSTPNGVLKGPTWTNATQPTIASITPTTGNIGSQVTINGSNFTNGSGESVVQSVQFTSLGAPEQSGASVKTPTILVDAQFEVVSDTQITAVVPDKATNGPVVVTTSEGSATSGTTEYTIRIGDYPAPADWLGTGFDSNLVKTAIGEFHGYVSTAIADAVVQTLPTSGPSGRCVKDGCPIPEGQSTPSVANTIGEYGYNIIYALMGAPDLKVAGNQAKWDANVGNQVASLASQANLLTFISDTIASASPVLGSTVGNAVATFVQKSFGNTELATAFAPFLEALDLPTGSVKAVSFLNTAGKDGISAALLSTFKPAQAQQALVTFFKDPAVQGVLQDAATSAVKVLFGLQSPDWEGAPQPPSNAVADYLGQLGATALLGDGSPYSPALGDTISGAVTGLFTNIGTPVATDAGNALVTLLNWAPPLLGQQDVPTVLSNTVVNGLFGALQSGCTECKPLPFPDQPPLLPSLAPAAGDAVTVFVGSLLSDSSVDQALGAFITDLVPGVLANQGVQDDIEAQVSDAVSSVLGDGLGAVVGPQIGGAVVDLVTNAAVSSALTTFVDTALGDFLGSFGVVSTLADAAGTLATAQLDGTIADVLPTVVQELKTDAAIDNGVDAGVTAAVAGLLGDTAVWTEVDGVVSSLVVTLLGDQAVQDAVSAWVANEVNKNLGFGPISVVGDQIGAAVVSLLTNPVVQTGLQGVLDTLFSDFWGTPGVVTAFSEAIGALASATLSGDPDALTNFAQTLQTNAAVQTGVQTAFGAAVAQFLGDSTLWAAVDQTLSTTVVSLTTDPVVLAAIGTGVSDLVVNALGEPLGSAVGPQVGDAVVALVSNPAVASALLGVVDTLFSDFISAPGVVDAFSGAASQWALVLLTTGSLAAATKAAQQELEDSAAVDNAVDVSVTAAVAELLGDGQVWAAVDATLTTLVTDVLGDEPVQQAVGTWVANAVNERLGFGPISVVGDLIGDAVVALITNPVVQTGLIGVVDTLVSDFWGTAGVVTAFYEAAG
ncbi:MAG: IPT/TIG domain-containing protein, partial [Mycobacterium sp.]|nr:IPT/TIG domain-containing protein [Mycobacterium sp.]